MIITRPSSPLLRRVPPAVWVGGGWLTVVLVRSLQRPDELSRLFRYHGNVEDAPLLVTAVVTTLVTALLVRVPVAAVAVALAGTVYSLGMEVKATSHVLFLLTDALVGYTAATRPRRTSALAAALPAGAVAADTGWRLASGYPVNPSVPAALLCTVAVAWLVGHAVRQDRAHTAEVRARASRQALTDERLRIARELHDVVAHNIGIIAIQAGVGSRVMDTQPAETRNALTAIEATSRDTLAGLRRMLGALRRGEEEAAPLGPTPGLDRLDELVARTAAAGVRVELVRRGEGPGGSAAGLGALPPDVDLAAFRIVQESVTNVVRHAGTRDCTVTVERTAAAVTVTVVDLGCGRAPAGEANGGGGGNGDGYGYGYGYGLTGMRERVTLLGGEFSAGPRPGGGFRVAALLPLPEEVGR
ncbi:histidine kinase [Kitasatospora sp. NPDC093806]|uniref:sensor histidine kinase n=1 Tax=Kitasatospora sp. NPDC093806 TaxID=3155075 RepID=UPI003420CA3F